jgi:hypothetical protein
MHRLLKNTTAAAADTTKLAVAGADADAEKYGRTPSAVAGRQFQCGCRELLARKADKNAKDQYDKTPRRGGVWELTAVMLLVAGAT